MSKMWSILLRNTVKFTSCLPVMWTLHINSTWVNYMKPIKSQLLSYENTTWYFEDKPLKSTCWSDANRKLNNQSIGETVNCTLATHFIWSCIDAHIDSCYFNPYVLETWCLDGFPSIGSERELCVIKLKEKAIFLNIKNVTENQKLMLLKMKINSISHLFME